MEQPIQVLTMADDRYAMPLAVMGRSLLDHHRSGRLLDLKVIDGGITPQNRARVARSWDGGTSGPVRVTWVSPDFGGARELPVGGGMAAITYARLFLNTYFERSDDRVVVLDSDTLVLADIAGLYDADLEGAVVGACVDPFIPTISAIHGLPTFARIGIPDDSPYFNGGVMVADLRLWREQDIGVRALQYVHCNRQCLRVYDQDALNCVLAHSWKRLDATWNIQPRTPGALGQALPADARIVHFSGRLKPWLYNASTTFDAMFHEVLARTEWRGYEPPATFTAMLYRLYDSPVRRLVYGLETRFAAVKRRLELRRASNGSPVPQSERR